MLSDALPALWGIGLCACFLVWTDGGVASLSQVQVSDKSVSFLVSIASGTAHACQCVLTTYVVGSASRVYCQGHL